MSGTLVKLAGPAFLGTSVANIYTPQASPIYTVITHIHIANVTALTRTFKMYIGATGASVAGTELYKDEVIAANSHFDLFDELRLSPTEFLTGAASNASSLVITITAELVVVL